MAKIKIMKFEVGKKPYFKEIENDWREMQKEVGGFFENVYLEHGDSMCVLVCNDCGKLNGSKFNRFIVDEQLNPIDAIYGDFFIASETYTEDGYDLDSISEKDAKVFAENVLLTEFELRPFINLFKELKLPPFEI